MVAVSYHDTVNVLQAENLPAAGPFDRPEWFELLGRPLVALAADGERRAALVLAEANGRLERCATGTASLGARRRFALLEQVVRDLRDRTHRVTLWPMPDEDGSATRLAAAFRSAGWRVAVEPCDHNHVLPVSGRSFAQYWEDRPGKMRTTLKRKAKKVEVAIHDQFDPAAWAATTRLRRKWKPKKAIPHSCAHCRGRRRAGASGWLGICEWRAGRRAVLDGEAGVANPKLDKRKRQAAVGRDDASAALGAGVDGDRGRLATSKRRRS